jgi:multidrug efflux pump subunit AcrA (membrane-fusion protein)
MSVLDLTAAAVVKESFHAAATTFVTEVAARLNCDRVSLGFVRKGHCHVVALSHSAGFTRRMNLVNALGLAMDEAIDQNATIIFPQPEGAPPLIVRHHEEFVREYGDGAVLTVPMGDGESNFAALTLERREDQEFDEQAVRLIESLAAIVGPMLEDKRRNDQLLLGKVADSARQQIQKITGPRHFALKFAAAFAGMLLLFLMVATGDFRISARSALEGAVQRAVVAPFDGYIASAGPRAGDVVQAGSELGALEDKDLRLEFQRWASQRAQLLGQYREALAKHDRAQSKMIKAQIDQAEAQLALTREKLSRTRLRAPFDGMIVTGDLSQSLGGSVRRGDVLFEVTPLDGYRVILNVDERDIAYVEVGQAGSLVLSSIPEEPLPFRVSKITPVSVAEEGRNFFRVEAALEGNSERLRPGMEGIGKVKVGERKLLWIWTRELTQWLRLWFWSWLP